MNDRDSNRVELLVRLLEAGYSQEEIQTFLEGGKKSVKGTKGATVATLMAAAEKQVKQRAADERDWTKTMKGAESIASVVGRRMVEGATREVALRHANLVSESRPVRVTREMLNVLGGPDCDTLPKILGASVSEVTRAIADPLKQSEEARRKQERKERPKLASAKQQVGGPQTQEGPIPRYLNWPENVVTQIITQAVQQTAFAVQRIITVAIEESRTRDGTNPIYPYPFGS